MVLAADRGDPGRRALRRAAAAARRRRLELATLPLELFVGETGDYRINLSQREPQVYVLWRPDADDPPEPFHVTVCHSETQDYLDGGDVMAAGVPMPEPIDALLHAYVEAYHVDVPFRKRKRTPLAARPEGEDDDG